MFVCAFVDPLPILDQAGNWQAKAQKTHGAELEVKNLKERIAALQQEFAELKNQGENFVDQRVSSTKLQIYTSHTHILDVTIRQLREKIKSMETEADSNIQVFRK
jgi:flagellar biosynthesis chaperone FliJ